MTVIHILMAPRYLYNNRFTYYVITQVNGIKVFIYIYIKHVTYYVITHSVSTSHNNGTYYVRLDVESVRDTQLNC